MAKESQSIMAVAIGREGGKTMNQAIGEPVTGVTPAILRFSIIKAPTLKARNMWMAVAAATLLWTPAPARAQEPTALVAGLNVERTLGPRENHVYTINLQEGAAVIGEADQHGVDLVIDILGPDGKAVRAVDSSNGAEGPEPIDVTAFKTGLYKLVIRTLDAKAEPGKYMMKIDRVLTIEENGQRLAEKNYPPALQNVWRAYLT